MPLKLITKTIHEVDAFDLDEFIQEVYNHEFELIADQESSNDTAITYSFKKEPLNKYHQKYLDAFIQNGRYNYLLPTLMQDMVNRDLIPEGDYVIEISW